MLELQSRQYDVPIHIPYSTEYTRRGEHPKKTDVRVYSGLIRSKLNDIGRLRDLQTCSFVFNEGKSMLMPTQLGEIKWQLAILDP